MISGRAPCVPVDAAESNAPAAVTTAATAAASTIAVNPRMIPPMYLELRLVMRHPCLGQSARGEPCVSCTSDASPVPRTHADPPRTDPYCCIGRFGKSLMVISVQRVPTPAIPGGASANGCITGDLSEPLCAATGLD